MALGLAALLLGCPPSPTPEPTGPDATPPEPTPALSPEAAPKSATGWPTTEGWTRVATIPAIQRRPDAIAGSRAGSRVALIGPRGRRITLVADGEATAHIVLPAEFIASDLVFYEPTSSAPAASLVVASQRSQELIEVALVPGAAQVLDRQPMVAGRTWLGELPSGGWETLDALQRPDPARAAVRGVLASSQQRYRGFEQDKLVGIVSSGPAGTRRAMLARIPLAKDVEVLGVDPGEYVLERGDDGEPAAEPKPLGTFTDRGWLAAWTGDRGEGRRLHFVRFDSDGRVLLTTPAPKATPSPPPEAADLRAVVVGAKDLVLAIPGDEGLEIWRFVPGADGQRLRIQGLAPTEQAPEGPARD